MNTLYKLYMITTENFILEVSTFKLGPLYGTTLVSGKITNLTSWSNGRWLKLLYGNTCYKIFWMLVVGRKPEGVNMPEW